MKFGEHWRILIAVVKWGALIMGGLCLLIYSASIGYFPEGIGLGEGLAFYFISFGFFVAYIIYWLGLTSVGSIATRPLISWLQRKNRSAPEKAAGYLKANLTPMWEPAVFICAAIAIVIALILVGRDVIRLWPFGLLAVLQGFLAGFFLISRRRTEFDRSGLLLRKDEHEIERVSNEKTRRIGAYVILGLWVSSPILFSRGDVHLVDAAFRIAQLRKDHATVHVRVPWNQPFHEAGLAEGESFLGKDYRSFKDVKVLLQSIGTSVVVELPVKDKGVTNRRFPKDIVYVE